MNWYKHPDEIFRDLNKSFFFIEKNFFNIGKLEENPIVQLLFDRYRWGDSHPLVWYKPSTYIASYIQKERKRRLIEAVKEVISYRKLENFCILYHQKKLYAEEFSQGRFNQLRKDPNYRFFSDNELKLIVISSDRFLIALIRYGLVDRNVRMNHDLTRSKMHSVWSLIERNITSITKDEKSLFSLKPYDKSLILEGHFHEDLDQPFATEHLTQALKSVGSYVTNMFSSSTREEKDLLEEKMNSKAVLEIVESLKKSFMGKCVFKRKKAREVLVTFLAEMLEDKTQETLDTLDKLFPEGILKFEVSSSDNEDLISFRVKFKGLYRAKIRHTIEGESLPTLRVTHDFYGEFNIQKRELKIFLSENAKERIFADAGALAPLYFLDSVKVDVDGNIVISSVSKTYGRKESKWDKKSLFETLRNTEWERLSF